MSNANFVQCQISAAITAGADSISLAPAVNPYQLPPQDGGVLILADSMGQPSNVEIVRYVSRIGLVLSGVQRGQEGTIGRAWPIGSYCYQSLTAGEFGKVSAFQVKTASFTADANGRYWIGASITMTLPRGAGVLAIGTQVTVRSSLAFAPTVQAHAGEQIRTRKGSDTSILFDRAAEVVFVWAGDYWEIV